MDFISSFFLNFLFIGGGIALFCVPFLLTFYIRHRRAIREKRPHINQFMEFFLTSRESNALVFCWAASEALIWFVIPEFLLLLVVFMKIRHKSQLLIYDIAGTVAGTVIGLSLRLSDTALLHTPYIFQGMLTQTDSWYTSLGTFALIHQPFSGVPYKVFLAHAPEMTLGALLLFVLFAVIVRISRYAIGYAIFSALFPLFHRFVYRNYLTLLIAAVLIFTLLLMRISALYG